MENKKNRIVYIVLIILFAYFLENCTTAKDTIAKKTGTQLWSENCIRCHNIPTPVDFSDPQWQTIVLHMQVRANLTAIEAEKIVDFMKNSN